MRNKKVISKEIIIGPDIQKAKLNEGKEICVYIFFPHFYIAANIIQGRSDNYNQRPTTFIVQETGAWHYKYCSYHSPPNPMITIDYYFFKYCFPYLIADQEIKCEVFIGEKRGVNQAIVNEEDIYRWYNSIISLISRVAITR
jgi:hypothetical protein